MRTFTAVAVLWLVSMPGASASSIMRCDIDALCPEDPIVDLDRPLPSPVGIPDFDGLPQPQVPQPEPPSMPGIPSIQPPTGPGAPSLPSAPGTPSPAQLREMACRPLVLRTLPGCAA